MTTVPFSPPDDLQDRIDVCVDPDASPGAVLPVLAHLLLDLARTQETKRGAPATEQLLRISEQREKVEARSK